LGFQRFMKENNICFEYVAVDNDRKVLQVHSLLNPHSKTVLEDAWLISDDRLLQYDFVWASPPCESHSVLCWKRKDKPKPDMRLWWLIRRLRKLKVPFIVENVRPYYGTILKPTAKAGRHLLWSNLSLKSVQLNSNVTFYDIHNRRDALVEYHGLPGWVARVATRDMLRDMMHPQLSYKLAKQVIPFILSYRSSQLCLTEYLAYGVCEP